MTMKLQSQEKRHRLRLRELRYIANLRKIQELESVRPILEDLVREAYPSLEDKCLCSRCLTYELRRGAGRDSANHL